MVGFIVSSNGVYYLCSNPTVIPYNDTVSQDIIFAAAFLFTVALGAALPFGYLSHCSILQLSDLDHTVVLCTPQKKPGQPVLVLCIKYRVGLAPAAVLLR